MNLRNEIEEIYERWLLSEYLDEIHTKDEHIEFIEGRIHYETFINKLSSIINEERQ